MIGQKKSALLLLTMACLLGADYGKAAYDENLQGYTLDTVIVEADRIKDKFGDTITEQSYYRTGGDVKVITREEIERRHYRDLTEAIKRVPGITFHNPGYRGGEYGYQFYNNGVSINGDSRVIVLVDGRRVDNAASSRISAKSAKGSKSTGVNLDQVTNIENVEKIEVIKGPGASQYGADATGGVINIITRKGQDRPTASIDLSAGSWGQRNYALSYSGSTYEKYPLRYFVSVNRESSGDSKFKDGETGEIGRLPISAFKEEGANVRLDKELANGQSITLWFNHKNGKDGYPVAIPSLKFWNEADWYRILFEVIAGRYDNNNKLTEKGRYWTDLKQPGYHNVYLARALNDVKTEFNNNDIQFTYTFKRGDAGESFIRVYNQNHTYRTLSKFFFYQLDGKYGTAAGSLYDFYNSLYPNGTTDENLYAFMKEHLAPFPAGDQNLIEEWQANTGKHSGVSDWNREKNRGIDLQYAEAFGKHDVIVGAHYDRSKHESRKYRKGVLSEASRKRSMLSLYAQDKIHVNDNWDLTPSIRYSKLGSFSVVGEDLASQGHGSANALTYALNTQYRRNDTTIYAGATTVYRPLRVGDYAPSTGVYKTPLDDEKGIACVAGIRYDLNEKTSLGVHYAYTKMRNAIATLPIYDEAKDEFTRTAVNAREQKKSFNLTLDHGFNSHVTLSASYSYLHNKWEAKHGYVLDPSWGYDDLADVNTAINLLRPKNHYALNLSYENKKLYTGLLANWYIGNNTKAFSSRRFFVLDWNVNYELAPGLNVYLLVNNLTNTAYETSFNPRNGIGSAAMPARSILLGAKYTF